MKFRKDSFKSTALSAFIACGLSLAPNVVLGKTEASDTSNQILLQAETLLDKAQDVHYEHLKDSASEQIQNSGASAHNDCSGFVSYLLLKNAPEQYAAITQLQPKAWYPQAKTYAQFFLDLQQSNTSGWTKINEVRDLRRGDFLAWAKQTVPGQKPGNTGHVAIVAENPKGDVQQIEIDGKPIRFISVKVIDSSSVDHFAPDLLPPHAGQSHRDGLGEGFVRIVVDDQNKPCGYWEGTFWNEGGKPISHPSYTPVIGFARLTSRLN